MPCEHCSFPVEDMGGKFTRCENCEKLFCLGCFRPNDYQCLKITDLFDSYRMMIVNQIMEVVDFMIGDDL